jgi:hypothetical protein
VDKRRYSYGGRWCNADSNERDPPGLPAGAAAGQSISESRPGIGPGIGQGIGVRVPDTPVAIWSQLEILTGIKKGQQAKVLTVEYFIMRSELYEETVLLAVFNSPMRDTIGGIRFRKSRQSGA